MRRLQRKLPSGKYFSDKDLTQVISESETVTKALGHDFGEWTVEKEATATATGTERRDCSRCDAFETREYGPVATYQLVTAFKDGGEYLIVNANSGNAFALSNTMGAEPVKIEGGKITSGASNAVWTATFNEEANDKAKAHGDCFILSNGASYLDAAKGKVQIVTELSHNDYGWVYEDGQLNDAMTGSCK